MIKDSSKKLFISLVIIVAAIIVILLIWYFFLASKEKKESGERTLEDILREDLTAPTAEPPEVPEGVMNNLSTSRANREVSEEVMNNLTALQ